jgi:hypothetical protein
MINIEGFLNKIILAKLNVNKRNEKIFLMVETLSDSRIVLFLPDKENVVFCG